MTAECTAPREGHKHGSVAERRCPIHGHQATPRTRLDVVPDPPQARRVTLDSPEAENLARESADPQDWELALESVGDDNVYVLQALARRSDLPREWQFRVLESGGSVVEPLLCSAPNLDPDVAVRLLDSELTSVRVAAASHKSLTPGHVDQMIDRALRTQDSDIADSLVRCPSTTEQQVERLWNVRHLFGIKPIPFIDKAVDRMSVTALTEVEHWDRFEYLDEATQMRVSGTADARALTEAGVHPDNAEARQMLLDLGPVRGLSADSPEVVMALQFHENP